MVSELFGLSPLVWAAIAGLVALAVASIVVRVTSRQKRPLPGDVLDRTRKARERSYAQAKSDLEGYRKAIEKSHRNGAVIVNLVCDLGDQWEDRDAPRYISQEQAVRAQQTIQPLLYYNNPKKLPTLVIILHTFGGYSLSAQLIASAVHAYKGPKIAYVPYIAMSGGTKIALAADAIVMGKTACLGPTDTQHGGVSNRNLQALRRDDKLPSIPPNFLVAMYEAEQFDRFAVEHAARIIHPNHLKSGKKPDVGRFLASGEWSHQRPISAEDAVDDLGLNVTTKLPDAVQGFVDARIRMIDTQIEQEARIGSAETTLASSEDGKVLSDRVMRLKVTA